MIDPVTQAQLRKAIADCIHTDKGVLDALRAEIRPLKNSMHPIQSRNTTSISLVGTDGGNNQLRFDPFLVQMIRVVDSSNNEYCLEAVSPTTPIRKLDARQFNTDGSAKTALGEMMMCLGVDSLSSLSYMIRQNSQGKPISPNWVKNYRELVEWATLFSILKKDFATDTLIVFDGLLRSRIFAKGVFQHFLRAIEKRIAEQWSHSRRRLYLAGVAKGSKVLVRYRLAMALEEVLRVNYPAYVEVPREIEEKAYIRSEYARGDDRAIETGSINRSVGGKMFLVKFGSKPRDPVWPVDIFEPQIGDSQAILGSMLADALNGFPIAHYPRCLQKAHENAALVDFDFDVLQDFIYDGVRKTLGDEAGSLDEFQLEDADPAQRRYE